MLAQAEVSFQVPDAKWRNGLKALTLNCYLYRIDENPELHRAESAVEHGDAGLGGTTPSRGRGKPPVPVDCSYCLTAWSKPPHEAARSEHQLLSDALTVLLRHRATPPQELWGPSDPLITPYPVMRTFTEDLSVPGELWAGLEHPVKPSLNCVLTIAVEPDERDPDARKRASEDPVSMPDEAP